MPQDNKHLVDDPIDIVTVLLDTGGPHTTTSATAETVAEADIPNVPIGSYLIDVSGFLQNSQNNSVGLLQLLVNGEATLSAAATYESGTMNVPDEFFLRGAINVASPLDPAHVELQASTDAGTLSIGGLTIVFWMLAKRNVGQAIDLTPVP